MIKSQQLTCIGTLLKPHGIKGEIVAELDFEIDLSTLRCVVLDIDGIYVPFFLGAIRRRSVNSSLISIDGIADERQAKYLCGKDLFALTEELPSEVADEIEDGFYLSDLIGYKLIDQKLGMIGEIHDFDDSTENYLLLVSPLSNNEATVYIPFAEEFITNINDETNEIEMNLPEGLVELNNK